MFVPEWVEPSAQPPGFKPEPTGTTLYLPLSPDLRGEAGADAR